MDSFVWESENVAYFNSFGGEHNPKQIRKFIGNKRITNIYRIQAYISTMYGYFCIGSVGFVLEGKSLSEYTTLFSPSEYKDNGKVILKYFQ